MQSGFVSELMHNFKEVGSYVMGSFKSYFPKFFILASIKSVFDIIILIAIIILFGFVITIPLAIPFVFLLWITSLTVYIYVSQMIPATNQQTISNTNISVRQTIKRAISFSAKENIKAILVWSGIAIVSIIMIAGVIILLLPIYLVLGILYHYLKSSYESISSILDVLALVIIGLSSVFIYSFSLYLTKFYKFLYIDRGSATLALNDMKKNFTKNNMKMHIIAITVLTGIFILLSILSILMFIFISLPASFILGLDIIEFLRIMFDDKRGFNSGKELLVFLLFLPIYFVWYVIYTFSIEFVNLSTVHYYYRKISEQGKV